MPIIYLDYVGHLQLDACTGLMRGSHSCLAGPESDTQIWEFWMGELWIMEESVAPAGLELNLRDAFPFFPTPTLVGTSTDETSRRRGAFCSHTTLRPGLSTDAGE